MDETAKNSLQLPKPTADTHKIQDKLTTVGSGKKTCKLRLQYLICHKAKVKAATSAHFIYS